MNRAHWGVLLTLSFLFPACGEDEPPAPQLTIGEHWERADSGTLNDLESVAFGGSYVAVGKGGTILISDDGLAWEAVASGTTRDLHAITYASSRYVAVGDDGTILISPTGAFWTAVEKGTFTSSLRGVTSSASSYYASGYGVTVDSYDGARWTSRSSSADGERIAYTSKGLVRHGGRGTVATDNYGSGWTPHPLGDPDLVMYGLLDAGAQHRLLAVGGKGTEGWILSTDAPYSTAWSWTGNRVAPAPLRAVAVRNSTYVAVGENVVLSSHVPTGTAWSIRATGVRATFNAVVAGDNGFVAVGTGGAIIVSQ